MWPQGIEAMEQYDLSNLNVLVVDHNQNMLHLLRTILKELGIKSVNDAATTEDAFAAFKKSPPDLIFSDWVPGRDELKFLKMVRDPNNSANPFVPIIVVTAYSEMSNVTAARDLGMTEFLATPVSPKSVYGHICSVIRDKRPFIKETKFFGPDRRRHHGDDFKGKNKRTRNPTVEGEGEAAAEGEDEAAAPDVAQAKAPDAAPTENADSEGGDEEDAT